MNGPTYEHLYIFKKMTVSPSIRTSQYGEKKKKKYLHLGKNREKQETQFSSCRSMDRVEMCREDIGSHDRCRKIKTT